MEKSECGIYLSSFNFNFFQISKHFFFQKRTCIWKVKAHEGIVRGIVCCPLGDRLLSCGNDKTIKLWNIEPNISIVKEASFSKEEVNELEEVTTLFSF